MSGTTSDTASQILNAFVHRKKTRENNIALDAQRLVNLFRQLSVFKPEFVSEYNQLLLNSSDDVRVMMKDIVGGPTVRQYFDYLQTRLGYADDADENSTNETHQQLNANTGYLPNPDDDTPVYFNQNDKSGESIIEISHSNALAETLQIFQENNRKQLETLTEALTALKNQLGQPSSKNVRTNELSVNDLIQFQAKQQQAFEQMFQMQNNTLSALTKQLSQSLQTQHNSGEGIAPLPVTETHTEDIINSNQNAGSDNVVEAENISVLDNIIVDNPENLTARPFTDEDMPSIPDLPETKVNATDNFSSVNSTDNIEASVSDEIDDELSSDANEENNVIALSAKPLYLPELPDMPQSASTESLFEEGENDIDDTGNNDIDNINDSMSQLFDSLPSIPDTQSVETKPEEQDTISEIPALPAVNSIEQKPVQEQSTIAPSTAPTGNISTTPRMVPPMNFKRPAMPINRTPVKPIQMPSAQHKIPTPAPQAASAETADTGIEILNDIEL